MDLGEDLPVQLIPRFRRSTAKVSRKSHTLISMIQKSDHNYEFKVT